MRGPDVVDSLELTCRVNGKTHTQTVEPRLLLSDFLRNELRLTGTHIGCEQGICGACTVLLNGRAVRSCLVLAAQCADGDLFTIEGLAASGRTASVEAALSKYGGLQCGFCTPGFVVSIVDLIEHPEDIDLTRERIRHSLSGNLCRCTGYSGIVTAIEELMTNSKNAAPIDTTREEAAG